MEIRRDKKFRDETDEAESWKIFRFRPAPPKKAQTNNIILLPPNSRQHVELNPMPGNQMGNPNNGNQNIAGRNLNPGIQNSGSLDVEKGKRSRETLQIGSWQTSISNSCLTCLIIWLIIMAILTLLSLGFSIFALVVFFYNGDAEGNWNHLTAPDYVEEYGDYSNST